MTPRLRASTVPAGRLDRQATSPNSSIERPAELPMRFLMPANGADLNDLSLRHSDRRLWDPLLPLGQMVFPTVFLVAR
jgi:hypothetical protein